MYLYLFLVNEYKCGKIFKSLLSQSQLAEHQEYLQYTALVN